MDRTLLKGLRVLEHLAGRPAPGGVSELARELDMTKSNAHRTLQTLVAAGFVRAMPGGTYDCTLKVFELAGQVLGRLDVRQVAEPFMRTLADATLETIHLAVLDGAEVIYLHKIESPHPVRAYSSIGGRAPAHCVASGKALLAYQQDEALRVFSDPLAVFTPNSISTLGRLREELAQIRDAGFAVNRGEWRESVWGLAAIVKDGTGAPVAAIGISGPVDRLQDSFPARYRDVVMRTAVDLSRALGHNPALVSARAFNPPKPMA
ncbi:IclR family transcriptional regulator [Xanthobacter wiegelii]|uniref:IclR family transcriptional regulator n=1 Tax=Xanthobacter wiegelii TaxID=3119913 RepID=UPI0037283F72